jgi:hypothetical protein
MARRFIGDTDNSSNPFPNILDLMEPELRVEHLAHYSKMARRFNSIDMW